MVAVGLFESRLRRSGFMNLFIFSELKYRSLCMHPPSLIPRPRALGPFMLTSLSFGETPVPVCSCGAGALLVAQAL